MHKWIKILVTDEYMLPAGYVRFGRSGRRALSRFEAWAYLIANANTEEGRLALVYTTTLIPMKVGEICCTQQKLSNDFGWTRRTVRRFLDVLRRGALIDYTLDRKCIRIFVSDFEKKYVVAHSDDQDWE